MKKSLSAILIIFSTMICLISMSCDNQSRGDLPNIVYILADDLGYGDVSACNPGAAWATKNIDLIASEGMSFTDAHSGSAVCTPTRYGILTGRYSWRTRMKKGVLWSWDKPLIGQDDPTVGKLLQDQGYSTACVGKWHLGLGWQFHNGSKDSVDFSLPVVGGPNSAGFDYFFGITASLDIPPYVYLENDLATRVPAEYTENLSEKGWWRRGLTGDDFKHDQVLSVLTEKTLAYIDGHVEGGNGQPFFLYFPLPAPHTPILPTAEFQGKSKTNPYGDFVLQVDHTVGLVLEALERNGIEDETIIIFTSDNGCSPQANFEELAQFGHDPSYHFRGTKADIYEGGHRVPFLVRWPGRIKAGSSSNQVTCLTDLIATVAAIVGHEVGENEAVDSYNFLPVLEGNATEETREATVHHSVNGSFAIRQGKWKLIMCPGSGGWSAPKPNSPEVQGLPGFQLYNLEKDPGETVNLQNEHPDTVNKMASLLEKYILDGRSTPGVPQEYVTDPDWPGMQWLSLE